MTPVQMSSPGTISTRICHIALDLYFTHKLKQIIYISENINIDINIHRKIEYMNFTNVCFFSIWTDKNAVLVINMHRSVCRWVLAT